ncbi:hypothetical protein EK21DRAFT_90859 [Setomelanomma holmii]|uniref:Uncharacterized protein n=1 Tax=Setomelanomma holmii TaxID=210430 RepID=A0A9P4H4Q8_9PLEO|nr:hypothetical protein EK21DRAFT_90859 [Setomelanomma holmii]
MTSRPRHLLALPRELRDQIYGHLHHYVSFDWETKKTRTKNVVLFKVEVHQAPRLGVLLTCSQVYRDCLEAAGFKGLSAVLTVEREYGPRTCRIKVTRAGMYNRLFPCIMRMIIMGYSQNYRPDPSIYREHTYRIAGIHFVRSASSTVSKRVKCRTSYEGQSPIDYLGALRVTLKKMPRLTRIKLFNWSCLFTIAQRLPLCQ